MKRMHGSASSLLALALTACFAARAAETPALPTPPSTEAPRKSPSVARQQPGPEELGGSASSVDELTPVQVTNLVLLGKVWGFLKYHHPLVTAGSRQWDLDLFHVLPEILRAPATTAAQVSLVQWVDQIGEVPECAPCATLERDVQLRPSLEWLSDRRLLGDDLSTRLLNIYRNRVPGQQSYVGIGPTGNATFDRER